MSRLEQDPVELVCHLLGEGHYSAVPFGAGKFSSVYAVTERESGKEYVLRVAPDDGVLQIFYECRMMRQEPGIFTISMSSRRSDPARARRYAADSLQMMEEL